MPAPLVLNRVREFTLCEGVSEDIVLTSTVGKLRFSDFLTIGDRVFYYIDDANGGWESGWGIYIDVDTITRDTIISSSNMNLKVDFAAGSKIVTSALDAKILQLLFECIVSPPW